MERNLTLAIKINKKKNGYCRNINFFCEDFLLTKNWFVCVQKVLERIRESTYALRTLLSLKGGPFTFSEGRG